MYKLHVLDHEERNNLTPPESVVRVENPYLAEYLPSRP